MNLRDRINALRPEEREMLLYAFEQESTQIVKLPDNFFIGVNVQPSDKIRIIESSGVWSYGELL